jgi:hypothetical protein
MHADIDITFTAPDEYLPAALIKLVSQRDSAVDALQDFEDEHESVITDDYLTRAEADDLKAATDAVAAGKDPFKLPSRLDEVRRLRPKVIAAHRKLAADVRQAEYEVRRAYRDVAKSVEPKAMDVLRETAKAAEDAFTKYLVARGQFGASTNLVNHLRDWARGGRSSYADGEAIPSMAGDDHNPLGYAPSTAEPVAELREIVNSFERGFVPIPLVRVSTRSGGEMVLREDQAKALESPNTPWVKILGPAAE